MRKSVISGEDKRYHNIIENSINGIILHRLIRSSDDKTIRHLIMEVNKTFQTLTRLCSEEVVGKQVSDVFEDRVILEKLNQMVSTQKPIRFEGYFAQFDKHLEIFSFPTGNNEFTTVFTDISHRKSSERKKQEIEKELTSRLEQQSALSEISQLTLSSRSLNEIMQETMRIVSEALNVDYSKVLRFIPANQELEMEAGVGWNDSNIGPYKVPADLDSGRLYFNVRKTRGGGGSFTGNPFFRTSTINRSSSYQWSQCHNRPIGRSLRSNGYSHHCPSYFQPIRC